MKAHRRLGHQLLLILRVHIPQLERPVRESERTRAVARARRETRLDVGAERGAVPAWRAAFRERGEGLAPPPGEHSVAVHRLEGADEPALQPHGMRLKPRARRVGRKLAGERRRGRAGERLVASAADRGRDHDTIHDAVEAGNVSERAGAAEGVDVVKAALGSGHLHVGTRRHALELARRSTASVLDQQIRSVGAIRPKHTKRTDPLRHGERCGAVGERGKAGVVGKQKVDAA